MTTDDPRSVNERMLELHARIETVVQQRLEVSDDLVRSSDAVAAAATSEELEDASREFARVKHEWADIVRQLRAMLDEFDRLVDEAQEEERERGESG